MRTRVTSVTTPKDAGTSTTMNTQSGTLFWCAHTRAAPKAPMPHKSTVGRITGSACSTDFRSSQRTASTVFDLVAGPISRRVAHSFMAASTLDCHPAREQPSWGIRSSIVSERVRRESCATAASNRFREADPSLKPGFQQARHSSRHPVTCNQTAVAISSLKTKTECFTHPLRDDSYHSRNSPFLDTYLWG